MAICQTNVSAEYSDKTAISILAMEPVVAQEPAPSNVWGDSTDAENADKCAWTFGPVYRLSSGAYYNLFLGGLYYLIQRNWVNANGR